MIMNMYRNDEQKIPDGAIEIINHLYPNGCSLTFSCFGLINILFCVVNIIVALFLLVAGCMLSVGFAQWCSELQDYYPDGVT